jgi:hypothetical protein
VKIYSVCCVKCQNTHSKYLHFIIVLFVWKPGFYKKCTANDDDDDGGGGGGGGGGVGVGMRMIVLLQMMKS